MRGRTERERKAVLTALSLLTPDERAEFPAEIQRGDRDMTCAEERLYDAILEQRQMR